MATAHYVSLIADTKRASARGTRWILHRAIANSVFDTKLGACGEPFGDLTNVITEAEAKLAAAGVTVAGWTTFPKTGNLRAELAAEEMEVAA